MTYSMAQQAKIRDLLASHHIPYSIKVINRLARGTSFLRNRAGTLGMNMDAAYEYRFYVHKADLEKARAVLAGKIK
jgi:hypothetical protein